MRGNMVHVYCKYMLFPNTVDPRLSKPHLSESSFIRTHKFGGEYHYMFVNRYEYH